MGFVSTIGDPSLFSSGRTTTAWIGLIPRRYQAGTIDIQGKNIEAAAHILTRAKTDSALRRWGLSDSAKAGRSSTFDVAKRLTIQSNGFDPA